MLSCDGVHSPNSMSSKIHWPRIGVNALLETMSDHIRLRRGVGVPAFLVDSVVRAVVEGLAAPLEK
jgi:hypothetical protein